MLAGCLLLITAPAQATSVTRKKHLALDQYHKALQMREELNGQPEEQRAVEDYDRVIEAFRKVYHVAPTSTRADASVLAVAELLSEQSRINNDEKGFKSAIGQYEFLCREYPGSKYRFDALLSIGQIYREDLGNNDAAKATFEDFLKRYPNQHLAENARAALKEMEQEAKHPNRKDDKDKDKEQEKEKIQTASPKQHASVRTPASEESDDEETAAAPEKTAADKRKGLSLVTSLRYWSTPDYTRIAIDLQDEVKYEAGRVPTPDRIFFDLHDSRLASELIGKSYDIEDGLLKKVRVAQYKANVARVVLELDSLAEYSAFLLPNPYRLIIDVHGRKPARQIQTASANPESDDRSNSLTGVPQTTRSHSRNGSRETQIQSQARKPTAPSDIQDASSTSAPTKAIPAEDAEEVVTHSAASQQPKRYSDQATNASIKAQKPILPARAEVPTQNSDLGLSEIASLSEDPQQVKATSRPTSGPVVQNVAKRTPEKISDDDNEDSSTKTAVSTKTHKTRNAKSAAAMPTSHEAVPTAAGDLSLIRALGLKIGKIVVDAGHGGHDTGTIGPNGLMEKDLVLDVALRLGKLLEQKLGADVVYTRHDDTFIPLETRTAIANQNEADLFISIHANSSHDPSARGVETYYLNFTRSTDALEVAARENAVSETSVHDLQDLVKKIALKEKIDESREFAATVQKALYTGESSKNPGVKDRGVKKAPFIVLIGANMPSILAEISFVSNPTDERKLRTPEYRQRIAESLYRGVAHYAQGLSGVRVASAKQAVAAGQ
jgi:N-acetylmuramoyl-L-alanine amidase